jgi:hypothetical protein
MQTGNLQLDRQLARWYELKDHPVQLALVDAVKDGVRFPLVPAGRRSGKTERFKRFLVKQANKTVGAYFAAAPTHDQAKKIFWDDLLKFSLSFTHEKRPNIAERIIYLNNGSEIHVLGLDKPQRIEGIPWKGGGIDEFADVKPEAWESNIYPALNTVNPLDPSYRAWCWLLGVPDGLNHYYDLCQKAETAADVNFKVFHWMTAEIFPEMAEDAKKVMSLKQYKQEFEASFETASGRIYEDYSKANHTTETIQEHEQLLWYHDFNYTPLSSGVGVKRGDDYYLLEEIVLISAVALNSAQEFVERYKNHKNKKVIIYGDPAGKAGEKHSQASDYTDIEAELRSHGWAYERRVRSKAMSIKDSQNALRAKIKSADNVISLYVNTINAPYTHKGLSTVQLKKGSTFMEVESDYQHITTAVRYMMDYEHPVNKPVAYMPIRFSI